MEIILSKNAGFCPGVKRADQKVRHLANNKGDNDLIYTLGPLIHNRVYVSSLNDIGVNVIELSDVERIVSENPQKNITIVIRTHGITKESEEFLRRIMANNKNLNLVDMTCPSVKRIHNIAAEKTSDDTYFLLFGSPTHPESIGIFSHAKGLKRIITSEEDLKNIDFKGKIPILCAQTTQNLLQFIQIKKILKKLYTNAIFLIQYVVSLKIVSMRQLILLQRSML